MKRFGLTALTGCLLVAAASSASAGMPHTIKMKCAVGGKTFKHTTTTSYSVWGHRPDGKPYGSWDFPLTIPECPNGLLMYREFEETELELLEQLIESDEFVELKGTPHYRAQWLEDRLVGEDSPPWLLMRAIWEADLVPDTRRLYLAEFASPIEALPLDIGDRDSVYLRYLLANAYRELGRTEDTLSALDSIPSAQLPEDEDWVYLRERIELLGEVTRDGETGAEPLRMIPDDVAAYKCKQAMDEGETALDPHCETETSKAAIAHQAELEKW